MTIVILFYKNSLNKATVVLDRNKREIMSQTNQTIFYEKNIKTQLTDIINNINYEIFTSKTISIIRKPRIIQRIILI